MPKPANKPLAIALRAARERLAESQTEFAVRFGVDQATISRWEENGPNFEPSRRLIEQVISDIDRVHPINRK